MGSFKKALGSGGDPRKQVEGMRKGDRKAKVRGSAVDSWGSIPLGSSVRLQEAHLGVVPSRDKEVGVSHID